MGFVRGQKQDWSVGWGVAKRLSEHLQRVQVHLYMQVDGVVVNCEVQTG